MLVRSFLAPFDTNLVGQKLREIVDWKVRDPNMSGSEQRAMWLVVEKDEAPR